MESINSIVREADPSVVGDEILTLKEHTGWKASKCADFINRWGFANAMIQANIGAVANHSTTNGNGRHH